MAAASKPLVLKAGNSLIPFHRVREVRIENIEREIAIIIDVDGDHHTAEGFDAIEAVMALKPSSLEGRRLKWNKNAWIVHNFFGHPLMQLLALFGFKRWAIWLHDVTTPRPR